MDVVMLSPDYPTDMPLFTMGLAEVGATVIGLGEQPAGMLPEEAARALARYVQVPTLWDEEALLRTVQGIAATARIDRKAEDQAFLARTDVVDLVALQVGLYQTKTQKLRLAEHVLGDVVGLVDSDQRLPRLGVAALRIAP